MSWAIIITKPKRIASLIRNFHDSFELIVDINRFDTLICVNS